MNRMKAIRMAALFALIAGPLAAWMAPAAYAQNGTLSGTVLDMMGKPYPDVTLAIKRADGSTQEVKVLLRIDTPIEVDYYRNGGILPFVLRELVSKAA